MATLGNKLKSTDDSRWNVNPTWHHLSSMYQSAATVKALENEFQKYHHLRGCFYFAVGAVESFLNERMRLQLKKECKSEEDIYKRIRNTGLRKKINSWGDELFQNKTHKIPDDILAELTEACDIRNEISHPKHRNHAIYSELDEVNPDFITDLVSQFIASFHEGMQTPFQYWILGWNYVGMGGDMTQPIISNNMNGFVYSYRGMGFAKELRNLERVEREFMITLEGYRKLKSDLDGYAYDIEPEWEEFRMKPRLTRRWWDLEFLESQNRRADQSSSPN